MMGLTRFQLIVIFVCVAAAAIGVVVFSNFGGAFGASSAVGAVVIWGDEDSSAINSAIAAINQASGGQTYAGVSYVQKDPATYEQSLINAMASGSGPDLFLLPQDQILQFSNKIALIPYADIP